MRAAPHPIVLRFGGGSLRILNTLTEQPAVTNRTQSPCWRVDKIPLAHLLTGRTLILGQRKRDNTHWFACVVCPMGRYTNTHASMRISYLSTTLPERGDLPPSTPHAVGNSPRQPQTLTRVHPTNSKNNATGFVSIS